ncbi:hypothetical protein [Amycolatopsis anabasis]|uniref:hypothetical protein n=1 Tax=Amycolatopsis anabasis TaxID=1840409 RepID=UPI00131B37B1|nr:hypothetical protein [Amycolatopsis anabasis]
MTGQEHKDRAAMAAPPGDAGGTNPTRSEQVARAAGILSVDAAEELAASRTAAFPAEREVRRCNG